MFKKLKSIFIIEDEDKAKKSSQAAPPQAKPSAAGSVQNKKTPSASPVSKPSFDKNNPPKGRPDEKFINRLLGALEEHNVEGFDYLEYKQSLQNLGNVEMDEATKFRSALAMAKTMGATNTKLIDSASHYLKVLGKEEAKFLEAFKSQQSRQVSNRNQQIENLQKGITQREAQIKKLQEEIEAAKKSLEEQKSSISQANAKVEATKNSFYHAYHIVVQQIADDLEKMKQYLT